MLRGNPAPSTGALPTLHHSWHRAWFAHRVAPPPHCQWGMWLCPASGPLTAGLHEAGCVDGPQIARASGPPQSAQALHPHRPIQGIGPPCSSWGDGRSETRTWAHTTRRGLGCARAPTLRPAPCALAPRPASPPATWHPKRPRVRETHQESSLPFLIARFAASSPEHIQEGPLLLLLLSWLRRVSASSSCEEPGLPSRGSARLSVWSPGSMARRQRLPGSGAPAQGPWCALFSASRHVGSSQSRIEFLCPALAGGAQPLDHLGSPLKAVSN